ncbi:protein of unknown function [Vibrio tapetis subsp. tapetis]|uniref:Uncharacterized protein n=1 Tax=Vibrio tapetis subsp. tapetis TaxID=1671868 RepID=A0A2N8ZJE7_9VIBR|nr:protein of unknown function [Vibrio tapetis subsp. tapetis]
MNGLVPDLRESGGALKESGLLFKKNIN